MHWTLKPSILQESNMEGKPKLLKRFLNTLQGDRCASKIAEIFDFTMFITPITVSMKLDLHELCLRKLHWDDLIPNDIQPIWKSHFEMMAEMKNSRYQRAVVPSDAVDLNVTTLDFGVMQVGGNGKFSCQLIFLKSKLLQPRAELYVALINAYTRSINEHSNLQTVKLFSIGFVTTSNH